MSSSLSHHPELARCYDAMNGKIIIALAVYAGEAKALGYRPTAIEHLAMAVAITEKMDAAGRYDAAPSLLVLGDLLDADGPDSIKAEVFARANQLNQLEVPA